MLSGYNVNRLSNPVTGEGWGGQVKCVSCDVISLKFCVATEKVNIKTNVID